MKVQKAKMLNTNPKEVNFQGANLNVPQEEMLLSKGGAHKGKWSSIRGYSLLTDVRGCESWHCVSTVVV